MLAEAQMLSEDGEGTAAPVAVLSCAVCGAVVADTSTSSVSMVGCRSVLCRGGR